MENIIARQAAFNMIGREFPPAGSVIRHPFKVTAVSDSFVPTVTIAERIGEQVFERKVRYSVLRHAMRVRNVATRYSDTLSVTASGDMVQS